MDWHLNLFYSYNQDNELIENNLTRAFIIILRMLSPETRHRLLDAILNNPLRQLGYEAPSFHEAQMALQNHIDQAKVRAVPRRYLLTIASDRIVMAEEEGAKEYTDGIYGSIPDGWIYNFEAGWCFLIESKVGANPIDDQQIISHAVMWLGIDPAQLPRNLISLKWTDILSAIQQMEKANGYEINSQESMLLSELKDFLGYYGYRKFEGLTWVGLLSAPRFMLRKHRTSRWKRKGYLKFSDLLSPPGFKIKV